jgi:hypothetical protein
MTTATKKFRPTGGPPRRALGLRPTREAVAPGAAGRLMAPVEQPSVSGKDRL